MMPLPLYIATSFLLALLLLVARCDAFSFQSPRSQIRLTERREFASARLVKSVCREMTGPSNEHGLVMRSLASSSASAEGENNESDEIINASDEKEQVKASNGKGIRKRIASYFRSSEKDDGLTFRQRLAKMGLATVLSYGWISNTNAMILIAAAWYVFSAQTKMSPLYPGQWKSFLTVYAGFYVISNLLRPFRVTLAVAAGPYFDRLVNWIQRKTRLPKAGAATLTVLMVNLGGTILLMVGGVSLASLLSGVPIFAPKA